MYGAMVLEYIVYFVKNWFVGVILDTLDEAKICENWFLF